MDSVDRKGKQVLEAPKGGASGGRIDVDVQHVETTAAVDPNNESLRDEMAIQIKHSDLSLTSLASLQLYLFFFIAYCSMLIPFHRLIWCNSHFRGCD
jgi:hypothetical protein